MIFLSSGPYCSQWNTDVPGLFQTNPLFPDFLCDTVDISAPGRHGKSFSGFHKIVSTSGYGSKGV
jgi:hypothetical protein